MGYLMLKFDSFPNVYSFAFFLLNFFIYSSSIICLDKVIWFQAFLSNIDNSYTFIWFQAFLSNIDNSYTFIRFHVTISNQTIGLMGRVFANGPGDRGSISGQVIPKMEKMILDATLLNTQHYKVWIKGTVEQSWEKSSAFPYTSM